MSDFFIVSILDYGAGNVRSLRNAIKFLGFESKDISSSEDIMQAQAIIFPGQGSFKQAVHSLKEKGWFDALQLYISSNRPFFGICLGMQLLFEESQESPGEKGLGVIPGAVTKFKSSHVLSVPQIGWNGCTPIKECTVLDDVKNDDKVYFVHSYCALPTDNNFDWILTLTDYGNHKYISMVAKGNVVGAQFHPEKSGPVGLAMIRSFLAAHGSMDTKVAGSVKGLSSFAELPRTILSKRIIACLDVRANDDGDLVVTKGDQYDVREIAEDTTTGRGGVRNLGKPVALCKRYYDDGADEVVFLNITSFRQGVVEDLPMLQVLESASQNVFVPLTVGGGIREYVDADGKEWSALDVTARYFRAGADKVSIGSDAVYAAEKFLLDGGKTGTSSIEQISNHYGAQAVVVSIDPKRVYCQSPEVENHKSRFLPAKPNTISVPFYLHSKTIVPLPNGQLGPSGEAFCWWQVTVKGGRETRDMDAVQLAAVSEILGAGEIMLNCIDMDGQGNGYDIALIKAVRDAVRIPVIASSGAGAVKHFEEVFRETDVNAALAAGIFHRNEVRIQDVKAYLTESNIPVRVAP